MNSTERCRNWPRLSSRKAVTVVAAVLILAALGGTAAADTSGWNSGTLCTSNSPDGIAPPDACDTVNTNGGHGIDIHTQNPGTSDMAGYQALCVYDYLGNPSSCLQTLGGALDTFGRTAAGTNDGDGVDTYGNSDIYHPTNRLLSDGGALFGGNAGICGLADLVSESSCVFLSAADITALHGMKAAPSWAVLPLVNGWRERGSGFPSLAARKDITPPDNAQIEGQVVHGTFRNGEQIASVPSSLRPATEQTLPANCGAGTVCEVTVEKSGAVEIWAQFTVSMIQVNGTYVTDR